MTTERAHVYFTAGNRLVEFPESENYAGVLLRCDSIISAMAIGNAVSMRLSSGAEVHVKRTDDNIAAARLAMERGSKVC